MASTACTTQSPNPNNFDIISRLFIFATAENACNTAFESGFVSGLFIENNCFFNILHLIFLFDRLWDFHFAHAQCIFPGSTCVLHTAHIISLLIIKIFFKIGHFYFYVSIVATKHNK
jgi:hypothetical protein